MGLCLEQSLAFFIGSFAFGYVYGCADVFQEIAGYISDGVTCRANVLDRSAWKNDSEIHVKVGAFVRPFEKNFSTNPVPILWVNALVERFVRGYTRFRIEAKQAVILL
jgi:hypothetical protein